MKIEAAFVRSAASARDLPREPLAAIALVGRSNVGKSSLINALVRRRVARTSAAPGKTRLANVYRARRGSARPVYLVDLPGYGYARGDSGDFQAVAEAVFGTDCFGGAPRSALLLIDARHPGLENDRKAWQWLSALFADAAEERRALVATKIDKLSRGERLHAMRSIEAVFDHPVTAVSAETGEGLEELWNLIDRLANSSNPPRSRSPRPPNPTAAADKRRLHQRSSNSRR